MTSDTRLLPRLGLFDAVALIAGSMIGSGIFFAPAIMAEWVQSAGVLVGLWVFGGLFTILGALAYAELAAMSPFAGGQYVFLREAFGRFPAFLYGWTLFLVIQTGFNAAVSIAFAKYLGVFVPVLGESQVLLTLPLASGLPSEWSAALPASWQQLRINSAQLVACLTIGVLTGINIRGVREGKLVQNLFTVLKLAALSVLILFGLSRLDAGAEHFRPLFSAATGAKAAEVGFLAGLAVALSKALFAYDSWYTVTFVSEEVRHPHRTLPRSLLLGCVVVTFVYVLTNIAYLAVLSPAEMAEVPEMRVAQPVAVALFGPVGVTFVVSAILISTFGCVNGLILSGARVFFAMAREGLFFRSCAQVHPVRGTPAIALVFQGVWSCVLALSGSYNQLLTYTTSASVLFGALTVVALFRLRFSQPDRPRPYRCWGYPVTPLLYLVIALVFLIYVTQGDPGSALIGFALTLSGVPFYWMWRKGEVKGEE